MVHTVVGHWLYTNRLLDTRNTPTLSVGITQDRREELTPILGIDRRLDILYRSHYPTVNVLIFNVRYSDNRLSPGSTVGRFVTLELECWNSLTSDDCWTPPNLHLEKVQFGDFSDVRVDPGTYSGPFYDSFPEDWCLWYPTISQDKSGWFEYR